MDPNELKKWTSYSPQELLKSSKKLNVDLNMSHPQLATMSLEISLALAPQLPYLIREAARRQISMRELFENHISIKLND